MKSLREILADVDARHVAVGHFNISELATLKGILAAAGELSQSMSASGGATKLPILIGVSEGERDFIGVRKTVAIIRSIREEYDYPIFLNADHTHSLDKVREAAEAGFDEILFDGSGLPSLEENLKQTQEAVKVVRAAAGGHDIVVEGEIGFIGAGSEIIKEKPELILSTPEEAVRFVRETGVDVLAPAVGNMHGLLAGMVAGAEHKRLNIARIAEIKKSLKDVGLASLMTLHGGSGTADEDFVAAVKAGMTIVHVSSELRLAWRRGVESALAANPNEIAPYKLMGPAVEGMKKIVLDRLRLFNGL